MNLSQDLIHDIKSLIDKAKEVGIRSVDHYRPVVYWYIGERIFNEEQQGKDRADCGNYSIKYLSEKLQPEYDSGFSYRNSHWYRQFYQTFPIVNPLHTQLSWRHYRTLISIDNEDKREYYIAETVKNNCLVR